MELWPEPRSSLASYKRRHARTAELLQKVEATLIERGYQVLLDVEMQGGDRWPRLRRSGRNFQCRRGPLGSWDPRDGLNKAL